MFALFLLACGGLQLGNQVGERCETPCAVTLQHPLLPEGQQFAAFSLQGGDLVTASQAKLGSVTLLHPSWLWSPSTAPTFLRPTSTLRPAVLPFSAPPPPSAGRSIIQLPPASVCEGKGERRRKWREFCGRESGKSGLRS